jgi:hypothetical protein
MDPDPEAQKHADLADLVPDPDPDPQHCRKKICLNQQNKPLRKNIGRIRIPSTVLRSRSILPLSLSREILEEEQLYS